MKPHHCPESDGPRGTLPPACTKLAAGPAQSARYVRLEATERSSGAPSAGELNIATSPWAGREPVGWLALQYAAADRQRSVLMAYRLGQSEPQQTFHLRGLDPDLSYKVSEAGQPRGVFTGRQLAAPGLLVTLEPEWRSAVIKVEAQH